MNLLRRCSHLLVKYLIVLISLIAFSCTSSVSAVNTDREGFAIKGFDTVAYFTMGKPVKGLNQFTFEWSGAKWRFTSREHLDLFSADPDRYAPQYGGY